jgi:hypothetical protein
MAIGMPIAYALLVCGVTPDGLHGGDRRLARSFDSQILAQRFVDGADNFPLLAVPFFLLAGEFMNAGGLSRRIVNLAMAWVGHFPRWLGLCGGDCRRHHGLAVGLGGGRHGSAGGAADSHDARRRLPRGPLGRADCSGRHHRAGHSALHWLIIFGVAGNVSITKLFLAGIVPGIMMGLAIGMTWWWVAKRENVDPPPCMPWRSA